MFLIKRMEIMKELTRRKPKTPQILDELKEFSDEYIENVVKI